MRPTYEDLQAEVWDLRCRLDRAERGDESRDIVSAQEFIAVQAERDRLRDMLARYGSQEHALKKAIAELCELVECDRAPGVSYVEWHERHRDLIATETAPTDMPRRSRAGA